MKLALIAVTLACGLALATGCASDISLIEQAEGLRLCEYVDTTGHPTVCYGFNLDDSSAPQKIAQVGGNYNNVLHGGCLNHTQCVELLQMEVKVAEYGAAVVFGQQCPCVQAALVDMTYNLGEGGISTFTTFISYIKSHNWAAAAQDARGTLWCSQVGSRCTRDTGIIAAGCGGGGNDDEPTNDDDGGSSCPSACATCVRNGGGQACASRCTGCSSACLTCIKYGGGRACASKCT